MYDWLSSKEATFVLLCQKWSALKNDAGIVEKYKWEEAAYISVIGKIDAFLDACNTYKNVNSTANRLVKDQTKKEAVAEMRKFANSSVRYNVYMDDATRMTLGVPVRDEKRTRHGRPTVRPEVVAENTKNRMEHRVRAINSESGKPAKPVGTVGVRFCWQLGGEKPKGGEDLPRAQFRRGTSVTITYTEADKGKQVWYAACYENARGETGPWSLLTDVYIG